MNKSENQCAECGTETKAKNTMGLNGSPLCGPCKRQQQWRDRLEAERDTLYGCCDSSDPERIDDGIYKCFYCKKVTKK